ncbi:phage distal tail protein [Aneurinibacillus sp. REN35]|uniref:phage distal tail protein n=1 Tax=Aneurinibacillus sp. REN35 TaxID=3237286 RepID=UPI0035288B8E
MFNRGMFNTMPFNRQVESSEVFSTATLSGSGSASSIGAIESSGQTTLSGTVGHAFSAGIETFSTALLSGESGAEFIISTPGTALLSGSSGLGGTGRKFVTQRLQFTGTLQPGEQLVIDTEKITATINGQNALNQITGSFFDLQPGANTVTYADKESARNIDMILRHRGRFY